MLGHKRIMVLTKKRTLVDNRANIQVPAQFLAVLLIRITLMRIRILLFTLVPDPAIFSLHVGPDPDPTFQSDADSDPNPTNRIRILPFTFSQIWTLLCSNMTLQDFHLFTLMQIRIQISTLMRIRILLVGSGSTNLVSWVSSHQN
jgi:hypothetical protein